MRRRLFAAFCLAAVLITPAHALSDMQNQILEDIAQVMAGTQVCKRYKLNVGFASLVAVRYGVPLTNANVMKRVEERAIFHANRIKGRSEEDICGAMLRLYGPEGSNIKGLIARN
jgi:hypothetical protein